MEERLNNTNETPPQWEEKTFPFGDYNIKLRRKKLGIEEKEAEGIDDPKIIVKTMLKEILTVDALRLVDKNGQFVTEAEYDKVRAEIWQNRGKMDPNDYQEVVSALTYNDLSHGAKTSGVNFAINTLLDPENEAVVNKEQKEKILEIQKQFNELTKKIDKSAYFKMKIKEKENFMKELNELTLKLYGLI